MNRTSYRIIALCGFLFIIIVFSAATCFLTPNEENDKYSLNVYSDSGFLIKMIIGGLERIPVESGENTQYYLAPGTTIDAAYQNGSELWFNIRGTNKFPGVMPSTGMNISVTNTDIGILINSEQ